MYPLLTPASDKQIPQQSGGSFWAIGGGGSSSSLDFPFEVEDGGDRESWVRVLGRLFGEEDCRCVAMAIEKLGFQMPQIAAAKSKLFFIFGG